MFNSIMVPLAELRSGDDARTRWLAKFELGGEHNNSYVKWRMSIESVNHYNASAPKANRLSGLPQRFASVEI